MTMTPPKNRDTTPKKLEAEWYEAEIARIRLESEQIKADVKRTKLEAKNYELDNVTKELEIKLIKSKPVADGEFTLCGTIADELVYPFMHNLATWSNAHPGASITIFMDTDGGSVFAGFSLYDFLQRLRKKGHHLTIIGAGMAASMGSILLQAADDRVMTKRCWMLVHEVQGVVGGSMSEMDNTMKHNRRLQEQALDILSSRSKVGRKWIKSNWADDKLWFSAEDALAKGFIDRIEEDA